MNFHKTALARSSPPLLRWQTFRHRFSHLLSGTSLSDRFVGGLSYKVATHPVNSSQQPLRVQLGEAEVLHSTLAKPFSGPTATDHQLLRKECMPHCVFRFFLMIPAGLPQATIKELLRHNNQFMRDGK